MGFSLPAGAVLTKQRGQEADKHRALEAKDSALLSSRDAGLLEPPERPQGSPASSSVWREDPGLLEEGLSRSLSGGGGRPSFPSPSAGDLRELPRVPLRGEGSCGGGGSTMLYWPEELLLKVQLLSLWGSDSIFMSLLLLLLMFVFLCLNFQDSLWGS